MRKPLSRPALAIAAAIGALLIARGAGAQDGYIIDFETKHGYALNSLGSVTSAPQMVIMGTRSFLCDSMGSKDEWNDRLVSDPVTIKLGPRGRYTIDFDYRILAPASKGGFSYFYIRRASDRAGHDRGWLTWTSADGDEGHKRVTVDLEAYTDYRFVFGLHNKGRMVVDNIIIVKD